MSIAKIEKLIVLSASTLLGIFIYQFCLLNLTQAFPRIELEWILNITVLVQGIAAVIGIVSLFAWVYYEITHLTMSHHWRIK